MKSLNSDYDIRCDPRISLISPRIVANTVSTREYSRILRSFLGKKQHSKSTKWLIFTIFVEIFSWKSTFLRENWHFRDIRDYSRVFANITDIRARYSRPRIPHYSRRFANTSRIFEKKTTQKIDKMVNFYNFCRNVFAKIDIFSRKPTFSRYLRYSRLFSSIREYHRYLRGIFAAANTLLFAANRE